MIKHSQPFGKNVIKPQGFLTHTVVKLIIAAHHDGTDGYPIMIDFH